MKYFPTFLFGRWCVSPVSWGLLTSCVCAASWWLPVCICCWRTATKDWTEATNSLLTLTPGSAKQTRKKVIRTSVYETYYRSINNHLELCEQFNYLLCVLVPLITCVVVFWLALWGFDFFLRTLRRTGDRGLGFGCSSAGPPPCPPLHPPASHRSHSELPHWRCRGMRNNGAPGRLEKNIQNYPKWLNSSS